MKKRLQKCWRVILVVIVLVAAGAVGVIWYRKKNKGGSEE